MVTVSPPRSLPLVGAKLSTVVAGGVKPLPAYEYAPPPEIASCEH